MDLEDAGTRVKFVLHDRDASFTAAFDAVFRAAGVRVIRSAVQAPRMNSVMERWIGSCRRELLDRTLVWNQRHLVIVLHEYEDFYNTHRPHRREDTTPTAARPKPPTHAPACTSGANPAPADRRHARASLRPAALPPPVILSARIASSARHNVHSGAAQTAA